MFESVRIYDGCSQRTSMYRERDEIEFVFTPDIPTQLHARVFGNVYNLAKSRCDDQVLVYCPQDYRDFLTFLKKLKCSSTKGVKVYKIKSDNKQVSTASAEQHDVHYLIQFAANLLIDKTLSAQEKEEKKTKFINRCYSMLQEITSQTSAQIM